MSCLRIILGPFLRHFLGVFPNLVELPPSSLKPYKSPWFQQFRAVLWRSWHSVSKDPIIARIRIIEAIGLALLVGTIYFGQGPDYDQAATTSVSGALFWATTNQAFLNYGAVLGVIKFKSAEVQGVPSVGRLDCVNLDFDLSAVCLFLSGLVRI